jgi:signal transduction histidine kinase
VVLADAQAPTIERRQAVRLGLARLPLSRLSLTTQFLLANLVVFIGAMLVVGTWIGQQIQSSILDRTASEAAIYVDSVIAPRLQSLVVERLLDESEVAGMDQLLETTLMGQRVVAVKVWSVDGQILYSPNRELIGQRLPVDAELAASLNGAVAADITNLTEPENVYERERWQRLLQVYTPVRQDISGAIIAVAEFYQPTDQLEAEVGSARLRAWLIIGVVGGLAYLLLAGIVKRGSDTISRQDMLLRRQFAELALLHERVRSAAARTTALNEQALRRISADLHDGPGQALALALLRLDGLRVPSNCVCGAGSIDLGVVQGAVRDALTDIRTISAGLRLPELESPSVAQVVERAVRDHTRRTAARISVEAHELPDQAPLAIKIALLRTLQEALSNATRHAGDGPIGVEIRRVGEVLELLVKDRGPGFDHAAAARSGRLGLIGMRERAELLGGTFDITSEPGQGTVVRARWPLGKVEEAWPIPSE